MAILRAGHKSLLREVGKWVLFCLVLLGIAFHVSVKFWLGPAYIAMRAEQALSKVWSGPVIVGEVDFNYDGVMFVREVEFYDLNATEVIKAQGIRIVLGKWPSLTAPARRIEVEQLDVRLVLDADNVLFPLRLEEKSDLEQSGIEYMSINKANVSIEDRESQVVFDQLFAEVVKVEDRYELKGKYTGADDYNQVQLKAVFDLESEGVEIDLKFAQKAKRELMRVLLSAAGLPSSWDCEGKVDGQLRVRGNLRDFGSLWPEGVVRLTDWTVLENQSVIAADVNGLLTIEKRRLDLDRLGGALYKGSFHGSFFVDYRDPGPVSYGADVLATGIDMTQLSANWETTKRFTRGTGLLNLRFTGDARGLDSIHGSGGVFIDDADLWRFPVIGELFKAIGVWEYRAGGMSDAEVVFGLSGLTMTLERGHLSNRFSAIEAEPGASIDLRNEQIDMYVVALPLKNIDKIVARTPMVNWFVKFKDKIVRLRLKGHWSLPGTQLISKQPIKDVKEATKAFFWAVIDSGGELGEKIKGGFELFFKQDPKSPAN